MLPDNLISLHKHEEQIRAESLCSIERNAEQNEHLTMIHSAMAVVYALAHDSTDSSEDETTIRLLGLRLFNDAAGSLKLALGGYYQLGFSVVRDILETSELVDYFGSFRDRICVWKGSDKQQRINEFGPGAIRRALNARDEVSGNKRKEIYDRFSEYATHATAPGFQLLAPESLGKIGPFFNEKYLNAFVGDLVTTLVRGGTTFTGHFGEMSDSLLRQKADFLEQTKLWWVKHIQKQQ